MFFAARRSAPELPYDAEVKWLESTGTQYIDTDAEADQDVLLECRGKWTGLVTSVAKYAVYGSSSGRISFGWLLNRTGTDFGFSAVTSAPTSGLGCNEDWHSVVLCSSADGPYYVLDGVKTDLSKQGTVTSAGNIFLFGTGTGSSSACFRVSQVKITRLSTGKTIRDLIPVRITNELGEPEGAMYDKVSGRLFRSQGTGKLIVGADADMPYDHEVQYVEYHSINYDQDFAIGLPESVVDRLAGKKMNEVDFSAGGTVSRVDNGGNLFLVGYGMILTSIGPYCPGGATPPPIYASTSVIGGVVCQSLSDYHSVKVSISSGYRSGYIDGVLSGTASSAVSTQMNASYLAFIRAQERAASSDPGTKVRQSDVEMKIGDEVVVDGRPVVTADGSIGWYDYVSRQVYSAPSSTTGLSAGPVVSNEGRVPYAYKVEYIETDGVASYIDTGVKVSGGGKRFVARVAYIGATSSSGGDNVLYYVISGWNTEWCTSTYLTPASGLSLDTSGDVFYEIESTTFAGNKSAKVDGVVVGTSTTANVVPQQNYNYCLSVALNVSGAILRYGKVRIGLFQVFDAEDKCLCNLIPVVDRDGVACMYDYVSKTLRYNAADSGTITAGPRA